MKYSDLRVWQDAMDVAEGVLRIASRFPAEQRFVLAAQMQRAAISVPGNIAEGHGRKSTGAYINHLSIAAGSLRELQTQLELARRVGFVTEHDFARLMEQCDAVGRLLGALIRSLESRPRRASPNPES